ncbi:MAG: exonuclease [Desulfobacteraceae bacterium]|nr:exonuclease [Desulfobacteraceae bacterium]
MGLLSSTASVTRYFVNGQLQEPIRETIEAGLKKFVINDIDGNPSEQAEGWTSFEHPYTPEFSNPGFMYGSTIVFSLRLDKKSVPAKLVQKYFAAESKKRLDESGRDVLSANEKKMIKDHVINLLNLKMPAIPNVYDVVWHYEKKEVWFFSNLKGANESLETLFSKSFQLNLVRRIPYTMAVNIKSLTDTQREILTKLTPPGQTS